MVTDMDSPDWKALSRSGCPRPEIRNPMTRTRGRESSARAACGAARCLQSPEGGQDHGGGADVHARTGQTRSAATR
jgi:hypothetical protein